MLAVDWGDITRLSIRARSSRGGPGRASAGGRIRGRAVRTEAEHFQRMADVGVPMLFGNSIGPLNDGLPGDLDGASARPAQEMMVVLLGTSKVDRLAVLACQNVHLAGVHQESESPVNRGEPDVVPALSQGRMDLLGAAEIVEL